MRWRDLELEQRKPLDYKIKQAIQVIRQADETSKHCLALAFSAGKDSTVVADIIRRFCPEIWGRLHLIYGDTGVEYPECRRFWTWYVKEFNLYGRAHVARPATTIEPGLKYEAQRRIWEWAIQTGEISKVLKPDGKLKSTKALEALAPEGMITKQDIWPAGTRMGYHWCTDQYGWPMLGKAWSKLKARRINIDTFLHFSESQSNDPKLLAYYQVLRHVKISQACCDILKKEPAERIQCELDVDVVIKGLMASESRSRAKNFLTRGYLFVGADKVYLAGDPFWHCQPIAIWRDNDVWAYIDRYQILVSTLYSMGYTDRQGTFHKIKRNGCLGCATDLLFPNNHMSMLRRTHPKAWHSFMRRGMAAEIQKLQQIRRNGQMSLFDIFEPERLIEERPCLFDNLDRLVITDDTDSIPDPEII
jgi:3'-phosphoadenosine 5'-phosphosulfate sulfotransferase (PAPS reductase)/FAD synthetase